MSGDTPKRITKSNTSTDEGLRKELDFFNRYANRSKNPQDTNYIPELPVETANTNPLDTDDSESDLSFKSTESFNETGDITIVANNDNIADLSVISNTFVETIESSEEMAPVPPGQGIKIRDTVEFVPMFNDHNISLNEFIEACNEAKSIVDAASENGLVRLIRTRITGEARRTILNRAFDKVANLTQHFKDLYDSGETIQQLFGKLGYEIQRGNEGVIPFANRLRKIDSRIFEAKKKEDGTVFEEDKKEVEEAIVSCFRRGLKPQIETRLSLDLAVEEVMKKAVEIEKQYNTRASLLASVTRHENRHKSVLACDTCQKE